MSSINSIYFKNFMATATIVLVSFLLIGIAFVFIGGNFVINDARANMAANANEIIRITSAIEDAGDLESWDIRMTISMLSQGTGNHIFLCDAKGHVVSCSDKQLACQHMGTTLPQTALELMEQEEGLNQLTDLQNLIRVQTYCRLIKNQNLRIADHCLSNTDSLTVPF